MRRTVMMGMLAALLTGSASVALASGRYDSRSDDAWRPGVSVGVRFDEGWNHSGFGWGPERHRQDDRRFDRGRNERFDRDGDGRYGDRDGDGRFGDRDGGGRYGDRDGGGRFGDRDGGRPASRSDRRW